MSDPTDEKRLTEAKARIAALEMKALDLEDSLVRAESQAEVLENFCFGLERDHEKARRTIEERDALIFADLEQARRFQQAMLASPPIASGIEIEIAYRPLSQVGGDFYDVAMTGPSSLRLFIADATGHGIKAALQTMLIKAEYEAASVHADGPAELLKSLNAKVHRAYRGIGVLFTAVAVDVDLTTGRVRYACAAHPGPLVLRGGRAAELREVDGSFVGLSDAALFEEGEGQIDSGDALVLVTDGIAEASRPTEPTEAGVVGDSARVQGAGGLTDPARGPPLEAFGEARILEVMERASGEASIAKAVCDALDTFLAKASPEDDVTLVALRRR